MKKFELIGDLSNWMDFRDYFIEQLELCDTKQKLDRIMSALIASIYIDPNIKEINKYRRELGIKELTKEDIRKLRGEE